jgi:adenylate cyclase
MFVTDHSQQGRLMKTKLLNIFKLNAKRRKTFIAFFVGLFVTFGYYAANLAKPASVEQLGSLLFDSYQRKFPRSYDEASPVRIIDIDNESLKRIGQWPWPRSTMAKLNDRLSAAGAGVIAYDIVFSEADRTSPENILSVLQENPNADSDFNNIKTLKGHDQLFAESYAKTRVVTGFFFLRELSEKLPKLSGKFAWGGDAPKDNIASYGGAILPLAVLEEQVSGEGFVSFNPGGDGIVRTAPMVARIRDTYYRSLSLEALRVVQDQGAVVIRNSRATGELAAVDSDNPEIVKIKVGGFEFPTLPNGDFLVYYSTSQPTRFIPAWKILSDDVPVSEWADRVAGHIVFVGTGAEGLKDLVATPASRREPGVLVHAQVVEQIIAGQFLRRPYWGPFIELLILVASGLLLALVLPKLGATKGAILSTVLAGAIAYGSWYAFKYHLFLINPIYPLMAILTSYLLITVVVFYLTETERSRIRNAFSMYLSPTMVKKVSDDPSLLTLGGEERNMTILFLDIRSFSKISEGLQPQEITTFLNIFLTPMTNTLQAGKATIDKYIGDAIVAFWNAPLDDDEHERNAARAVMEMMRTLDDLNAKYADQTEIKWPQDVRMGIGLNTGICCVGNLGSDQRFSYSMIGDAANLASRIEGLTKQYKVHVLVGSSTAKELSGFAIVEADLIKVVGRQTPERIFILAGEEEQAETAGFKKLAPLHQQFLKTYRRQEWDKAEGMLSALQELAKPFEFDGYYDVMRARIATYKTDPPAPDWDGVFIATSK